MFSMNRKLAWAVVALSAAGVGAYTEGRHHVGAQIQQPANGAIPAGPSNPDPSTCNNSNINNPYYQTTAIEIFMCSGSPTPTWNLVAGPQVNANWTAASGASQILNKPSLATVATSGSYLDLINQPSIPAAQVNSDWAAASGIAQILNKPNLATVATSGSYNDLSNKPTIPTAYLTGTTGSIGGGLLGLLGTTTGTVSVSGSIQGKPCQANASNGALPGSWKVDCSVTSNGTVTVQITGLASLGITPPATTYNVAVFP